MSSRCRKAYNRCNLLTNVNKAQNVSILTPVGKLACKLKHLRIQRYTVAGIHCAGGQVPKSVVMGTDQKGLANIIMSFKCCNICIRLVDTVIATFSVPSNLGLLTAPLSWWGASTVCAQTGRHMSSLCRRAVDMDPGCPHRRGSSMPCGTLFHLSDPGTCSRRLLVSKGAFKTENEILKIVLHSLGVSHLLQKANVPKFRSITFSRALALGRRKGTCPTSKFFM